MGWCGAVKPRGRCRVDVLLPSRPNNPPPAEGPLASRSELSAFLEGVERRAFKQAMFALRDEEAALDVVQDAMLRLAEKYGHRPPEELPMLFHRIMQNAIRDWYRRQRVRGLWTTLLSALGAGRDDEDDPRDLRPTPQDTPPERLQRKQVAEIIQEELDRLPARQRQAFVMRYWQELDVAETAKVMGCSEGSVKTHCSRAARSLSLALRARGVTL